MRYLALCEKLNQLSERYRDAVGNRDLYQQAAIRLERAWVEMELRDLCGGAWTKMGGRYDTWMRDDLVQATIAANELARRIGDSDLLDRLFIPFPHLRAVHVYVPAPVSA